jgi:hypothetical protein
MKCNINYEDDVLRKLCTKRLLKLIDLVKELTSEPSGEDSKEGGKEND